MTLSWPLNLFLSKLRSLLTMSPLRGQLYSVNPSTVRTARAAEVQRVSQCTTDRGEQRHLPDHTSGGRGLVASEPQPHLQLAPEPVAADAASGPFTGLVPLSHQLGVGFGRRSALQRHANSYVPAVTGVLWNAYYNSLAFT